VPDVPDNAPEACPGTGSENAGKSSACAGCPNQGACSTGQRSVDPDEGVIADRLQNVKHKDINAELAQTYQVIRGCNACITGWAYALAADPAKQVAVLEVDICGPSQACMFGCEGESVHTSVAGWTPIYVKDNLAVMSIAFLLDNRDDAIIWRGPRKNALIKQFLKDVDWGHVDYLLIDTPPGTSDEHISVVQLLLQSSQLDGAIVVTTPQEVSLLDVRKEISFCKKTKVPVLGVVENMSQFVCPCCSTASELFPSTTGGAKAMCEDLGLRLLARLPHDPKLAEALDKGEEYFIESMPSLHLVVITGVSVISPYGVGVDAFWNGLKQSRNPLKYNPKLKAVVGQRKAGAGDGRGGIFAVVAAEEVLKDAGIAEGFDHAETGVNIGMGIADLEMIHETGTKIDQGQERRVSPFFVPRILTNIPACYVSLK
ncbi:Protein NUBP-1, partial [Aphelenchoides avenae]